MSTPNSMEIHVPNRPRRKSLFLLIAVIAALMIAGAVIFFKYPNVMSRISPTGHLSADSEPYFVETPQILINFNDEDEMRVLRFSAQLEVKKKNQLAVHNMMPRIVDVMNSYLRGLDAETIREPGTLFQIRSDLLIRTQVVAGEELVNKFLIKEFIIQ